MEEKQGKLFQIGRGNTAEEVTTPEYVYAVESADKDEILSTMKNSNSGIAVTTSLYPSTGSLDYSLKTWVAVTGFACGPTAAAITLDYFDDHHNNNFIPTQYESQSALANFITPNYIENEADMNDIEQGLWDIIFDRGLYSSYSTGSEDDVNFNKVISLVNSDKPVIVGLDNDPTYTDHWVVAHGYSILTVVPYADLQYYLVVNDGWGSNGIYIHVNDNDYLAEMVYIE